ncbi:MAG: TolC family protein [Burkholderiales bacterium]|nr:TolC family protein [Phycisphaerae bacterium]
MMPLRCACIISLLLLTGCHVDQKSEVKTYRQILDLTDEPIVFKPGEPLSLTTSLLLANQNDERLASRGEDYLRASISQRRDIATFLPTVDLVPVYSRRQRTASSSGSSSGSGEQSSDRYFDVPLRSSINIFNGFQDINRAWRDDYVVQQRRFELLSAQEQLMLDTAGVFYQVLRSEASVRVIENSLTLQGERFRDARGRVEAGVASSLAASQTEAQMAATRTTFISARSDVVQARSRLRLLTDSDVDHSPLRDDYDPPALPALEQMLKEAASRRDDLRAAESAVAAARRDVDVAIGQYYPSVSIDLANFLYRESVPTARSWDAMLRLNLPIFSGGRIEQDVREAWSNFRQALLARSAAERGVRSDVEQAYSALSASDERLAQLQFQVAAAQDVLNQADESYKAGRATNLERIQAQDALLQAQLLLSSEQYDRKLFHLTLLQRVGLLREEFDQRSPPDNAEGRKG